MITLRPWLIASSLALFAAACVAEEADDPRALAASEMNDAPPFLVRVAVDRPECLYRQGDEIRVSVRCERAGYLYLFYCDASRRVSCLFPNQVQSDNRIPAGQSVVVPAPESRFRLRVGAPFGNEVLKAVVTTRPLRALELSTLTKGGVTPVTAPKLKAVFVEAKGDEPATATDDPPRQWAEHHVQLTTVGQADPVPEQPRLDALPRLEGIVSSGVEAQPRPTTPRDDSRTKRVGVFVGISKYLDEGIRPLKVAHRDAETLSNAMRKYCQLDETVVLTNESATLDNIRRVVVEGLPTATRPGDLVFLFWSGHGGRCANLDGSEPDGYDEYLVPYDGRLEPADAIRNTMLMDKRFGRWVQGLDGRKLVVIIDACHSGGQSQGATKALLGNDGIPFRKFFFATTWNRTKDIGQRETAVLASSRATQVSFERRDGDLSVMTHFLIEKMQTKDGPLTLVDAAEYLKSAVPEFVEKHYPGTTQTPVFVNQTTPPLYLRP